MSISSFDLFIVMLLCVQGYNAAVNITMCPSGDVGSNVTITCSTNPPEAMTWKRDTDTLANCDTVSCSVVSSPSRYTFTTQNGGHTVTMTINPVETDDNDKEFKCETSNSNDSCILRVSFTTTNTTTAPTTVQPIWKGKPSPDSEPKKGLKTKKGCEENEMTGRHHLLPR